MKNLTWQNPEQLFVAQVLINKVKSKCCGIKDGDGFTYYGLHIRETGRKCVLVLFSSSKAMRMNVICHEASHACDAIEGNIEMKHGGEPSAYLIGWIASCINKARLGIGDFVEIVDKEEK